MTEGSVVWRTPKDAAASSAEKQGLDYAHPSEAEDATKGSGITPQTTSSVDKNSGKFRESKQELLFSTQKVWHIWRQSIEVSMHNEDASLYKNPKSGSTLPDSSVRAKNNSGAERQGTAVIDTKLVKYFEQARLAKEKLSKIVQLYEQKKSKS